jgi:hypothetical protein
MQTAVYFFKFQLSQIFYFLDYIKFNYLGTEISFLNVIVGFLAISIVVSLFWKGGKA